MIFIENSFMDVSDFENYKKILYKRYLKSWFICKEEVLFLNSFTTLLFVTKNSFNVPKAFHFIKKRNYRWKYIK